MVENLANVDYPIDELLQRRRSTVAFSSEPVEQEKLLSILEAARWAPSSYNEQPWSFIIATREQQSEYDRLLSCLVTANLPWAQNAPVLILSIAKLNFSRSGEKNRHAFHDVGLAAENMILQATSLGLFVHQMAGFNVEKTRELFSIPNDHEPVAMIAIGYMGDLDSLPEQLRERELAERSRKPLDKFVFTGQWGAASPLVNKER